MKKILTGFVFCLSITSCSLDTIPTSQYVEDNFWKTPEQIEAGLVACYSTMYNVYMYGSNLILVKPEPLTPTIIMELMDGE